MLELGLYDIASYYVQCTHIVYSLYSAGALVEREIQQLVKSRERQLSDTRQTKPAPSAAKTDTAEPTVQPRPIAEGDVCPICQDDMTPAQVLPLQ